MSTTEIDRQWTTRLRRRALKLLPPEKVMPDTQPTYVSSWIYVFGVTTMAGARGRDRNGLRCSHLRGPQWWHGSSVGHFVNSLHLWSVEIFFFAMVIHLWGKYFMAAWPGAADGPSRGCTGVRIDLRDVDRDCLHGLPRPNELRLAVDRDPGEGRHRRDRGRRILERLEYGSDADVAHCPVADRSCRHCRTARTSRSHQGSRATL